MIEDRTVSLVTSRSVPPRRRSRLIDLGAVTLAFIAGVTLLGAYATYRIWDVGRRDDSRPADAIVVLGAAQYNGTPSAVLAARLDHAIELYNQRIAPFFVVTGGKLPGDRTTEAETERLYAVSHGVPAGAILVEDTGRTTLESMQHVRAIFEQRGLKSAVFVSDRTHMLRVLTMAADQGIVAYGSPTTTSPTDTDAALHVESLQHELGALALYFLVEEGESTPPAPLSGRMANGGVPAASPSTAGGPGSGAEASAALATSAATSAASSDPSSGETSAETGAPPAGSIATGGASGTARTTDATTARASGSAASSLDTTATAGSDAGATATNAASIAGDGTRPAGAVSTTPESSSTAPGDGNHDVAAAASFPALPARTAQSGPAGESSSSPAPGATGTPTASAPDAQTSPSPGD